MFGCALAQNAVPNDGRYYPEYYETKWDDGRWRPDGRGKYNDGQYRPGGQGGSGGFGAGGSSGGFGAGGSGGFGAGGSGGFGAGGAGKLEQLESKPFVVAGVFNPGGGFLLGFRFI